MSKRSGETDMLFPVTLSYRKFPHIKKLFIFLLMILCSCETITPSSTSSTSVQTEINEPLKTIRNDKCEDVNSFKVFYVQDAFVLANVCEEIYIKYSGNNIFCDGHVVFIPKEKDKIYYNDQMITVKSDECPIYVGTYKYTTTLGVLMTVPIVKFVKSQIPYPQKD